MRFAFSKRSHVVKFRWLPHYVRHSKVHALIWLRYQLCWTWVPLPPRKHYTDMID